MSIFWTPRKMLQLNALFPKLPCVHFLFLYKKESQKGHLLTSSFRSCWRADHKDMHGWPSRKWLLQPTCSLPLGRTNCCTEKLSYLVSAGSPAWGMPHSHSCKEICGWPSFAVLPPALSKQWHRVVKIFGMMNPHWVQWRRNEITLKAKKKKGARL